MLLTHVVKEVTDVDLDDSDLDTRICDLRASERKSMSSSKKYKACVRSHIKQTKVFPMKGFFWKVEVFQTWLNIVIFQKL